jgi:hypothetical protein
MFSNLQIFCAVMLGVSLISIPAIFRFIPR